MLPSPLSPDVAVKRAGEPHVTVYARTMGLDGVNLRYFKAFGPRQDPSSPYSGVISRFATMMGRGERPVICGDGTLTRDDTYVENVVAANRATASAPGPLCGVALNVGTGRRNSLLDLVAAINRAPGTDLEPRYEPTRAGDVRDSLASLGRVSAAIGDGPVVGFGEGLRRTLGGWTVEVCPELSSNPNARLRAGGRLRGGEEGILTDWLPGTAGVPPEEEGDADTVPGGPGRPGVRPAAGDLVPVRLVHQGDVRAEWLSVLVGENGGEGPNELGLDLTELRGVDPDGKAPSHPEQGAEPQRRRRRSGGDLLESPYDRGLGVGRQVVE